MVVNERQESGTEILILNAALDCLANEAELKSAKAAEIERMAATVAGGVPAYWAEISGALPRLKKRGQNAVVLALLGRRPPITDTAVFVQAARQLHQLDHNVRAGLVARLSRLGEATEAGRQLILMLQNFEKESSFRVSSLAKVSANDLGELHRLLTQRSSELMLFPRAVLRLALDWTVRLQGSTVERRTLISQMPRLLAKLKWRDLPDALILQFLSTIAEMGEGAGLLYRTLEWGLLFKFILKHLRTRVTGRQVLLELGRLLAACRAELMPKEETAEPKVNRVTYDPQSGAAWTSVPIYPPHVKPPQPAASQAAETGDEPEETAAAAEAAPDSPAARAAFLARMRPCAEEEDEAEGVIEAADENGTESNGAGAGEEPESEEATTDETAGDDEPQAGLNEAERQRLARELDDGRKLLRKAQDQSERHEARLSELREQLDALRQEMETEAEAHRRELERARELETSLQGIADQLGQDAGRDDDRISA